MQKKKKMSLTNYYFINLLENKGKISFRDVTMNLFDGTSDQSIAVFVNNDNIVVNNYWIPRGGTSVILFELSTDNDNNHWWNFFDELLLHIIFVSLFEEIPSKIMLEFPITQCYQNSVVKN